MKKFISIIICSCFMLTTIIGCATNGSEPTFNNPSSEGSSAHDNDANNLDTKDSSPNKINIITTIFAPYDFTREIVGEHADITMLLPPGSESHSYEPSPRDIIKIQDCDVFIHIGGESDKWLTEILDSIDTSNIKIVTLMDCVDVVEEELVEGMEDDHDHDDNGHDDDHNDEPRELDEHVWTSPKNAKLMVAYIAEVLSEIDSTNAAIYEENATAYLEQLNDLDNSFQEIVDSGVRKTIIFGDRFPFRYLADAYDLDYFAAFPGCSTETEPSAATIAFLIDKVNEEHIPVVFHAELSNMKMANTISEATGAAVLLMHSCHNVTRDELQNGVSYIELMQQNALNLKEALS